MIAQPTAPDTIVITTDRLKPARWRRLFPTWFRNLLWLDDATGYDAFLSYSWKSDLRVASVVQSSLHRFLRPWYGLRGLRVFRDLSCLAAGSSLEAELRARIDRSTHFIVLASTQAATSTGMEMEAAHWLSRERPGMLIVIITSGSASTWEEIGSQVLPPIIRKKQLSLPAGDAEQVWADLRPLRERMLQASEDPELSGELTEALQQVFVRLHGKDWGVLRGEERSQRRRALSLGATVMILLIALSAGLLWQTIEASDQAKEARRQAGNAQNARTAAEKQAALAKEGRESAEQATLRTQRALAASTFQEGVARVAAGFPLEALAFLSRSMTLDPTQPAPRVLTLNLLLCESWPLHVLQHPGDVVAASWSPDGTRIATASSAGTAQVWNAETGRPVGEPIKHRHEVQAVAWSPDGKSVATGSWDGTAQIWSAATGRPLSEPLRHAGMVWSVAWSPDGKKLATASYDKTIKIWDAETGKPFGPILTHHQPVLSVAWNPDGRRIASGSQDNTAQIWDSITGQRLTPAMRHNSYVEAIAWSPDGSRLATGSTDQTACIWDAQTGLPRTCALKHRSNVTAVAWNPDGTRLATASVDHTARVWDAQTGQPVGEVMRHQDGVNWVSWDPNGLRLATSSYDQTARIWDARTGKPIGAPLQHRNVVGKLDWSKDGTRLLTATNSMAWIWLVRTGQQIGLPLIHGGGVQAIAWGHDPRGRTILTGSSDHTAQIWDAFSGERVGPPFRHADNVDDVAWSSDGSLVATASIGRVYVWNTHGSRSPIREWQLDDQKGSIKLAWSPVGARLSITAGPTVSLWNHHDGRSIVLKHPVGVLATSWSPDGKLLATGSGDQRARIWDTVTGQRVGTDMVHTAWVWRVAWSPDGTRLATAQRDHAAFIWNGRTGERLSSPMVHAGQAISLDWSPDGTKLLTASDGGARVWDGRTGEAISAPIDPQKPMMLAQWSPDGTRLVTVSHEDIFYDAGPRRGDVRLWDSRTGQPLGARLEHADGVTTLSWSPDGLYLATGSFDGAARVWDTFVPSVTDVPILAKAAELVSGFQANDEDALIHPLVEHDRQSMLQQLRNIAGIVPQDAPSASRALVWFFKASLQRQVSPHFGLSANAYVQRMLEALPTTRAEAQLHFPTHAAFQVRRTTGPPVP